MKSRHPIDHEAIPRLQAQVCARFSYGPSEQWTHGLYEELSEQVLQQTGVLLSANTLKRFFGKIKSSSAPSKNTLNTLAQFCGYESYYQFVQQEAAGSPAPPEPLPAPPAPTRRRAPWLVLGLLLGVAGAAGWWGFFRPRPALPAMKFSIAEPAGQVPFTQIFKYRVPPAFADTIYFEEFEKGPIALSTRDSIFSYMHFVPGFRYVSFRGGGQLLWETTYQVDSDGWLFVFPHGGLEPRKYVPLAFEGGALQVTPDELAAHQIDLAQDGGWANYFHMQDYGVEGTAFTMETRFRNELKRGAQQCQDAIVTVECQHFLFAVHFTQQGCQRYASVQVGSRLYGGIKHDWTALTLDMGAWNQVRYRVAGGVFRVEHEGDTLLELPFQGEPGRISGLHFSFRGLGEVGHVAIKDGQGQVVYEEGQAW